MFFFNIDNLEKEAVCDSKRFVQLLEAFYYKRLPRRYNKFKPAKLTLIGSSYLLNPEPLFTTNVDSAYVVQYVSLAGRRDYSLYKHYGSKSLQLNYFPDINMESIKTNPLLNITQTEIFFLFEEAKKEIKWH
jgi:hypothetical protein